MPEYSLAFSKKLNEAAGLVIGDGTTEVDARRTAAYLSLLSTEISLKAMLEKAGYEISAIKRHSHNLKALLTEICRCKVKVQLTKSKEHFVSAAEICPLRIAHEGAVATFGKIIEAEERGASQYPNQVRYGDKFIHYHPEVLRQMAAQAIQFAEKHWDTIKK